MSEAALIEQGVRSGPEPQVGPVRSQRESPRSSRKQHSEQMVRARPKWQEAADRPVSILGPLGEPEKLWDRRMRRLRGQVRSVAPRGSARSARAGRPTAGHTVRPAA